MPKIFTTDMFPANFRTRIARLKVVREVGKEEQGQALVETAVIFVILILIMMALVDFGRAYFTFLSLQNAAAEDATYGMFHPTWQTAGDNINPDNIEYRVRHESENGMVDWSTITVTVESVFPSPGNLITVTLDYDFELITPVSQAIARSNNITLRAFAIQTIIRDDLPSP
jgi:hypothetical protein